MELRPEEISKIIRSQIKHYETKINQSETGTVILIGDGIARAAQAAAGERPVRVSLGAEHYPTRDYGTFALPAGVYTSLRVTLGAGEGHNWWCVIFPPLCAQAAGLSEQTVQALSDDDVRLVTESDGGYVVRFRLLELWDALVQRLS